MKKKRVFFIINPIAGGKDKQAFAKLAASVLDHRFFETTYWFTERAGHAMELADRAVGQGADAVIAVGGDGTVNEIASVLVNTPVPLGIIPVGSGNGLALFLGIPKDVEKALLTVAAFTHRSIDSGMVNGTPFFNMAGMGFDAAVSSRFATTRMRGRFGYVRMVLTAITDYEAGQYTLEIDGTSYTREAFMISIANSSQYGNNAHISPQASVDDGLLDACIIKPFPLYKLPLMVYRLFRRTADRSGYVEIIRGRNISISTSTPGPVHVDGEVKPLPFPLSVTVRPASLQIIC